MLEDNINPRIERPTQEEMIQFLSHLGIKVAPVLKAFLPDINWGESPISKVFSEQMDIEDAYWKMKGRISVARAIDPFK